MGEVKKIASISGFEVQSSMAFSPGQVGRLPRNCHLSCDFKEEGELDISIGNRVLDRRQKLVVLRNR